MYCFLTTIISQAKSVSIVFLKEFLLEMQQSVYRVNMVRKGIKCAEMGTTPRFPLAPLRGTLIYTGGLCGVPFSNCKNRTKTEQTMLYFTF